MKKSAFFIPLLALGMLTGCPRGYVEPDMTRDDSKLSSDTLFVHKVDNIPEGFIMGVDASSIISEEQSGVKYYNHQGQEEDGLKILSDNGVNYIRVRIWNDPYDKNGKGYGGGNNDLRPPLYLENMIPPFNLAEDFLSYASA